MPRNPLNPRPGALGRKATSGTRFGNGAGYGGPAKGVSVAQTAEFEPGNKAAVGRGNPDWGKITDRDMRTRALEDLLFNIANCAERDSDAIAAARGLHAIYNGTPVARTLTHVTDDISGLSDDALRTELARTRREVGEVAARAAPEGMSGEPGNVVH